MKTTMLTTENAKKQRKWYEIDATDVILGKLSVKVANLLSGRSKVNYTPGVDCGDYVIITNGLKIKLTGNKLEDKKYYSHSGWIGSLTTTSAKQMMKKHPEKIILDAVSGMLPKNRLGKAIIKKLFVYPAESKDHSAQSPIKIKV